MTDEKPEPAAYHRGSAPVGAPMTAVPAYTEPPRRRPTALIIGLIIGLVAVLLCGLCGVAGFLISRSSSDDKPSADDRPQAKPAATTAAPTPPGSAHSIVYEVSGGDRSAIITYATANGARPDEVDLPWHKEVTVDRDTFVAMVFVLDFQGGSLTCRLLIDGKEITKNTADNSVTCTHVVVG